MGIPVDWKPERAVQEKVRDKAYYHVSLDHLASRIRYQLSGPDGIDQTASSSTEQQSDETLEDIKAIAELKPSGFFSHSCFVSFSQNCINSILLGDVLLLGRQPPVHKTPIYRQIQKKININSLFQTNCQLFFLFLFCFAKNVQCSFLIYAFDINCWS